MSPEHNESGGDWWETIAGRSQTQSAAAPGGRARLLLEAERELLLDAEQGCWWTKNGVLLPERAAPKQKSGAAKGDPALQNWFGVDEGIRTPDFQNHNLAL